MVICLERDTDLHTAQLMPLPFTVSCSSKIQIIFTFLVPAHLGSPGKRPVKWVCVYRSVLILCYKSHIGNETVVHWLFCSCIKVLKSSMSYISATRTTSQSRKFSTLLMVSVMIKILLIRKCIAYTFTFCHVDFVITQSFSVYTKIVKTVFHFS